MSARALLRTASRFLWPPVVAIVSWQVFIRKKPHTEDELRNEYKVQVAEAKEHNQKLMEQLLGEYRLREKVTK
eukprot:EC716159.1.p1 GENE.EC716159.1~~EC716159.1.p1  ORF type:complete len:73 (+),score=6.13 EC716159.1:58-276(+)